MYERQDFIQPPATFVAPPTSKRPMTKPPPAPPLRRKSAEEHYAHYDQDIEDDEAFEISTDRGGAHQSQNNARASTPHRKSVSFDLSDNEYIPVLGPHDDGTTRDNKRSVKNRVSTPTPKVIYDPPNENLSDIFLSQLTRSDAEIDADGYEIPIQYTKNRQPQVKGILRSPSPSPSALSTTSSLDRPVIINPNQMVTAAVVHTRHDERNEIERENPFRKEFLANRQYENIYEEIQCDVPTKYIIRNDDGSETTKETTRKPPIGEYKVRPKSAHYPIDSAYTEIKPKSYHSNENLLEDISKPGITTVKPVSKSMGNLAVERPKHRPPLPPKPPQVKHADVLQNEALKVLQSEMERGNFYEFKHEAQTNEIKSLRSDGNGNVTSKTPTIEVKHRKPFNPGSPLPPLPPFKVEKPATKTHDIVHEAASLSDSPPPPPINLATLPTLDKLHKVEGFDEHVTFIPSRMELIPQRPDCHHENSPDNILVTEEAYREILLQENEVRNIIQQERDIKSRIPVRKAPPPPPPATELSASTCSSTFSSSPAPAAATASASSVHQPSQSQKIFMSSIPTQIFPPTQILPVQYSQLPMPQQPGYYQAFPPPQLNLNYSGAAGYSYVVSDNHLIQPNIVTNIGPQGINDPVLSPFQHYHHHHAQNYCKPQNFVNVLTSNIPSTSSNLLNTNWNYEQQFVQQQQQQQNQLEHLQHQHQQHHHHTINTVVCPGLGNITNEQIVSTNTSSHNDNNNNNTIHSHSSNTNNIHVLTNTEHIQNLNCLVPSSTSSFSQSSIPAASIYSLTAPEIATIHTNPSSQNPLRSNSVEEDDPNPTLITFGKQTSV